jgi:hypothetical protein
MNNHEILKQFRLFSAVLPTAISTRQHPPHNRLHHPLAVRLRAHESGFKLVTEGYELFF